MRPVVLSHTGVPPLKRTKRSPADPEPQGGTSNTPTNPTPVLPPTPLTIAVYAPGGRVTYMAESKAHPVVAGVHGSNPVAIIS